MKMSVLPCFQGYVKKSIGWFRDSLSKKALNALVEVMGVASERLQQIGNVNKRGGT